MVVDTKNVGMASDPVALLRTYRPGGKPLLLAARVSGETKSAFPDGVPKPEEKKPDEKKDDGEAAATEKQDEGKPVEAPAAEAKKDATPATAAKSTGPSHVASGRVNVIIVADTDFLADQFWVETRELMGQQLVTPSAHNAAFVVGALENLSGSDDLIALRGRGVKERRFTLVESLRRGAEREFREKEQALTEKLKNVEQELSKLQASSEGGNVILTETEQKSIERFRGEMLATRSELRQVKLALRRDIDRLDGWLKFANIALVPLLIGLSGLGWSLWRGWRAKEAS
jgi:ABC-type uncharacterized transport system involved in gliding motility auxiliary subunit